MNGCVFKLNDIVDNERGLRFIDSNGESTVFGTLSGYRYYSLFDSPGRKATPPGDLELHS